MAAVADAKAVTVEAAKPVLVTAATLPVFTEGSYCTKCIAIDTSNSSCSPPKPLSIVTPIAKGTYNVILFFHGTSLCNKSYSRLFDHMASHGFIVVAPQVLFGDSYD